MPESVESLVGRIENATQPGFRGRLVARGLARGMIWSGGQLPPASPLNAPQLSGDLLSYGLSLIGAGLRLRLLSRGHPDIARAFERGGEAIEAVVRNGDPAWPERGFYRRSRRRPITSVASPRVPTACSLAICQRSISVPRSARSCS